MQIGRTGIRVGDELTRPFRHARPIPQERSPYSNVRRKSVTVVHHCSRAHFLSPRAKPYRPIQLSLSAVRHTADGLTGLAGVTTRPAGYPSGGVPPAVERQLHLHTTDAVRTGTSSSELDALRRQSDLNKTVALPRPLSLKPWLPVEAWSLALTRSF
jgi:hypothetical protein